MFHSEHPPITADEIAPLRRGQIPTNDITWSYGVRHKASLERNIWMGESSTTCQQHPQQHSPIILLREVYYNYNILYARYYYVYFYCHNILLYRFGRSHGTIFCVTKIFDARIVSTIVAFLATAWIRELLSMDHTRAASHVNSLMLIAQCTRFPKGRHY